MEFGQKGFLGLSDRVLFYRGGSYRIGWVGFYDWDDSFPPKSLTEITKTLGRNVSIWKSGKGFHAVSLSITDFEGKRNWFEQWETFFGGTPDYKLQRDNVLRISRKRRTYPILQYIYPRLHSETVSGFHWRFYRRYFPRWYQSICYPIPSFGRAKFYASDPNGVFENFDRRTERESGRRLLNAT